MIRRLFKRGDRVSLGDDHTGTVLDEVTHDWLGDPFQILDIQLDGVEGMSMRISDTRVAFLDEETP